MSKRAIELEVENMKGTMVISSWEFYQFLGLDITDYSRWIKSRVIKRGKEDVDYFNLEGKIYQDEKSQQRKKVLLRLHLHIDYAIGLTILQDTYLAKSIRRELMRIRDQKKE